MTDRCRRADPRRVRQTGTADAGVVCLVVAIFVNAFAGKRSTVDRTDWRTLAPAVVLLLTLIATTHLRNQLYHSRMGMWGHIFQQAAPQPLRRGARSELLGSLVKRLPQIVPRRLGALLRISSCSLFRMVRFPTGLFPDSGRTSILFGEGGVQMLRWAILFLIVAIIAGVFGFGVPAWRTARLISNRGSVTSPESLSRVRPLQVGRSFPQKDARQSTLRCPAQREIERGKRAH